ncbi:hypothetical protein [Rhizobium chutanense]|uniref:hypothetical protein n=1 Tax=Rhizobium chutanense TaxID=2035448 RepID=UPI000F8600E9|nr:hypothetical protein [Rhizobium chutanense]
MPYLGFPWVIGPVPIILTVWAAYACGIAVAKQRPTSGEAFLGALFLPSGLIAIGCQLVLSHRNFTALLICGQIAASVCFLTIMHVSGFRRVPSANRAPKEASQARLFMILLASYMFFNLVLWFFPGADKCTIAKCFVYEWALGRIDHIFAKLYLETLFGALLLTGILSFLYYEIPQMCRDHFSK